MIALFFDTETTGIKRWDNPGFKPALVQLGAILQDLDTGRVLAELNLIANQHPGTKIPAEASNVHGIDDRMADLFGIDPKIVDFVFAKLIDRAELIVAHNTPYDLDIVKDNMPLTHIALQDENIDTFDTMASNVYIVKSPLSEKQINYFRSHPEKQDAPYKVPTLIDTYKYYFGESFDGAHDAMADIRACRDIFLEMLAVGWFEIVDGSVIHTTDRFDQLMVTEGVA